MMTGQQKWRNDDMGGKEGGVKIWLFFMTSFLDSPLPLEHFFVYNFLETLHMIRAELDFLVFVLDVTS